MPDNDFSVATLSEIPYHRQEILSCASQYISSLCTLAGNRGYEYVDYSTYSVRIIFITTNYITGAAIMTKKVSDIQPLSDEDILEDEDTTSLSLMDIYNQLLVHNEIILTIPIEQEEFLRKGLAGVKAKQNQKLRASNIVPDNMTLSYIVTPNKDNKEAVDVQITLAKRTSITVLGIKLPDTEI